MAGPPRVPLHSLTVTYSCLLVCLPLPGSSFGLAEFSTLQLWDWAPHFQAGCQVGPVSARIGYPPTCLVALCISKPARGCPDRLRCPRIGKQPPTTIAQAESLAIFLNSSSPTLKCVYLHVCIKCTHPAPAQFHCSGLRSHHGPPDIMQQLNTLLASPQPDLTFFNCLPNSLLSPR